MDSATVIAIYALVALAIGLVKFSVLIWQDEERTPDRIFDVLATSWFWLPYFFATLWVVFIVWLRNFFEMEEG